MLPPAPTVSTRVTRYLRATSVGSACRTRAVWLDLQRKMERAAVLTLCLVGILASSCAGARGSQPTTSDAPTPTPTASPPSIVSTASPTISVPQLASGTVTIDAGDHFFSPARLTVAVGATVVWKVVGQSTHDVVAADGSFASSLMTFGGTFQYTFTKPGRYPYFCTPHAGDGMTGEIIVQ